MASSLLLAKRAIEIYIVVDLSCNFFKNVVDGSEKNGSNAKNPSRIVPFKQKDLLVIENLKAKSTQTAELNILH